MKLFEIPLNEAKRWSTAWNINRGSDDSNIQASKTINRDDVKRTERTLTSVHRWMREACTKEAEQEKMWKITIVKGKEINKEKHCGHKLMRNRNPSFILSIAFCCFFVTLRSFGRRSKRRINDELRLPSDDINIAHACLHSQRLFHFKCEIVVECVHVCACALLGSFDRFDFLRPNVRQRKLFHFFLFCRHQINCQQNRCRRLITFIFLAFPMKVNNDINARVCQRLLLQPQPNVEQNYQEQTKFYRSLSSTNFVIVPFQIHCRRLFLILVIAFYYSHSCFLFNLFLFENKFNG